MREILVITHGNLAKEIVRITEQIVEHSINVTPICFESDLDPSRYTQEIKDAIGSLDPNHQVIILTDLFGGTPSNIAIPFIQKDKVEVITGINLPMLIYLLSQPEEKSLAELCLGAKKTGEEAIIIVGEFLS